MHIARIQVEEGFLDGLDLSLVPGLVTLIGARGTGKTSVIELIRFALGVPGYTPELAKRSLEHALSVLQSGQVTLTIVDGARTITTTRTAQDDAPRTSAPLTLPIVFSQTEIENIGLQPGGRMRLLDGFMDSRSVIDREEAAAVADVRSLSLEASTLRQETEELEGRRAGLPGLEQSLAELAPQEAQLSGFSEATAAKSAQLAILASGTSERAVAASAIEQFGRVLGVVQSALAHTVTAASQVDPWPTEKGDLLAAQRSELRAITTDVEALAARVAASRAAVEGLAQSVQGDRLTLEEQARGLRREIEELQAGAGTIMRQAQQIRERKAQLDALGASLAARKERFRQIVERRDAALDRLEALRERRYEARQAAISDLNAALHPRIRLSLTRCGQHGEYADRLADALRGSGLRYGDLSQVLAQKMSPRELVEAVEQNDIQLVSDAGDLSADRALKLIGALKDVDLGALATILVEDDVCFELLDGKDYKDIADLSTGQRCTVILPIILQHHERLLVVDQPEDHIDNAFIADTLIQSVNERSASGQIVFSTHNANIPVLGKADAVVELGSDGKRGFVKSAAPLDDAKSVDAITKVMEGGEAAFAARADFYQLHSLV